MSLIPAGLAMFFGSIVGVLYRQNSTIATKQKYKQILSTLLAPVVNPTAQKNYAPGIDLEAIFQSRKKYFKSIMSTSLQRTKFIHIAGTKGKGSTTEYIAAGLRSQGYKVGVFTSPHIHSARERIKIGKTLISREDIVRLGSQVINEMKDFSWTVFFDLFLAMAIKYFNEHNPDYVLLETGIGGRFDSTNFVDSPAACVITSISLDHQSMLGDTTEQIAWQKAGITKPGSAVFTASSQEAGVLAVFKRECEDKGACLHVVPVSRDEVQHFRVAAQYDTQTENLCVSAAVLTHLGIPLTPHTFQSFFWPCRMEVFPVRSQGRSVDVVVDGCHNLHSVELFLAGLRGRYPGTEVWLLFGCGIDKNFAAMLGAALACDKLLCVRSSHFRSMTIDDIKKEVPWNQLGRVLSNPSQDVGVSGNIAYNLAHLIELATQKRDVVIGVCGSLFVAAEAREALQSLSPELFDQDDWVFLERDED